MAGIFWQLEDEAEVHFDFQFHSWCTGRGGFSLFMVLQFDNS